MKTRLLLDKTHDWLIKTANKINDSNIVIRMLIGALCLVVGLITSPIWLPIVLIWMAWEIAFKIILDL